MQNSNNMQIADKKSDFHEALVGAEDDDRDEALLYQRFILGLKISPLHQRHDCSPGVMVTTSAKRTYWVHVD